MTKDEIQQEYQKVAAAAGDAWFRLDRAQQVVQALDTQLKGLKSRKAELEAALEANAKEEAKRDVAVVDPTSNPS